MSSTFDDYSFLKPFPELFTAVADLEEFIGDMDGKMMCSESSESTVIDEGTVDAEHAVVAFNKIMNILRSTHTAAKTPG
jgi:hypothetical protein